MTTKMLKGAKAYIKLIIDPVIVVTIVLAFILILFSIYNYFAHELEQALALCIGFGSLIWVILGSSILVYSESKWNIEGLSAYANIHDIRSIMEQCESNPSLIESVKLLETLGGKIVCELKLTDSDPLRVQTGINAVGMWLKLKSLKEGKEAPEWIVNN